MGGSGGGGLGSRAGGLPRPGGSGIGGVTGTDACALRLKVDLESVDAAVLLGVPVGTECAVTLTRQAFYDVAVVAAPTVGNVGSLAGFPGLMTLIQCIKDGNVYTATVMAKTANTCRVQVTRTVKP